MTLHSSEFLFSIPKSIWEPGADLISVTAFTLPLASLSNDCIKNFAELFRKSGKSVFDYQGTILYKKSADTEYMTDNPNRRCPSIDKARKILSFNPVIDVNDGVERYLRFLKNTLNAWIP